MNDRLTSLLSLLSKEPKDTFLLYGVALEYISKKEYQKAEEYLNKLLKEDPKYVPAYMQFARLKENLDEVEEAKKYYKEGIKAANENGDKRSAKEMEEFFDELE